jgi:hypothetical protein
LAKGWQKVGKRLAKKGWRKKVGKQRLAELLAMYQLNSRSIL